VKLTHANINFNFRPDFVAFSLAPIHALAGHLFSDIKLGKSQLLKTLLFDPNLVPGLIKPGSISIFADFLDNLVKTQSEVFISQRLFPPMSSQWPRELNTELRQLREPKGKLSKN